MTAAANSQPTPAPADPDLGQLEAGHVCKHGVRWPHGCRACDGDAWRDPTGKPLVGPE